MFNAAPSYETYVVGLDDLEDAEVSSEVLVQTFIMAWHRTLPGWTHEPACGMPVPRGHVSIVRSERLTQRDGLLCPDCFSVFELARAAQHDVEAEMREELQLREEKAKRDEFFKNMRIDVRKARSLPAPGDVDELDDHRITTQIPLNKKDD